MESSQPQSCFISTIKQDAKEISQLLPSPTSARIVEKISRLASILHQHFPCFQKQMQPKNTNISVIVEESVQQTPVLCHMEIPTCKESSSHAAECGKLKQERSQEQQSLLNLCQKMLINIADLKQKAEGQFQGTESQNFNLTLEKHELQQIQDLLSIIPKELIQLINMAQPPQEKTSECLSNHNSKQFCQLCNEKSSKRSLLTEQLRKRKLEENHPDDIEESLPHFVAKNSFVSQKRKYSKGNFSEPPMSFSQFSNLSLKENPGNNFESATEGRRGRLRTRKILGEMNMEEMSELEIKPGKNEKSCSKCLIY